MPIPEGADAIVIQEDAREGDGAVTVEEGASAGNLSLAGLDFARSEVLMRKGHRFTARDLALAAAAGFADVPVRRKPRIAVLATGDELVRPGETLRT